MFGNGARISWRGRLAPTAQGQTPDLRQRAWHITAELGAGVGCSTGAIAAFGGRFSGWSLYLKDGTLKFHYNYGGFERTTVTANAPLGESQSHEAALDFSPAPDGSASAVLFIDGREVGRGRVPRVMRNITHETFDLGCDLYTPVTEDYASPAFLPEGALGTVTITAKRQ